MIFITVSTGHFDPLIQACCRLNSDYKFVGQIGSSQIEPPFEYFRTGSPEKIVEHMKAAEIVITHAGTGMLSMLYGLKKKSIVVPKQKRYGEANDGQVELAKKWGALGMGILCLDVTTLRGAIDLCRQVEPTFPRFPSLGRALREQLHDLTEPQFVSPLAENT